MASGRTFPGDLGRGGEFSLSQVVDCERLPRGGSDGYVHFGEVGKEKSSLVTPECRERGRTLALSLPFDPKTDHSLVGQCWGVAHLPQGPRASVGS